jgi:hypothetical protein
MVLMIAKTSGELFSAALAEGRSGVVLVGDRGFSEPLELRGLSALEFFGGERPVLTATWGTRQRPFGLWPESVIAVGYEDESAPGLQNDLRSATFTVGDIASVSLDLTRRTVVAREAALF